ncbi:MAG: hypothetical protein H9W81_12815 [Enterococcus sp.]|nr:hypothetical protein [Enterococcus sp.]
MQDKNKGVNGPTYVMPKVSVVIQRGDYNPQNKYTYSYSDYVAQNRKSLLGTILGTVQSTFIFLFAVIMLAIPVSVGSVLIINTAQSQGVVTIRTQDVPDDGTVSIHVENNEVRLLKPAGK